jgi:hypothetical protein
LNVPVRVSVDGGGPGIGRLADMSILNVSIIVLSVAAREIFRPLVQVRGEVPLPAGVTKTESIVGSMNVIGDVF